MLREIALRIVWAMLTECAPDHAVEEKLHHYWVRYKGRLLGPLQGKDVPRQLGFWGVLGWFWAH